MELDDVLSRLKELDKIISSEECNLLSSYLNGWLVEMEDDLHKRNLVVSNKWLELRETLTSDSKADRLLETTQLYQDTERLKLTIKQLKRMRSDLKSRYEVLSGKRGY